VHFFQNCVDLVVGVTVKLLKRTFRADVWPNGRFMNKVIPAIRFFIRHIFAFYSFFVAQIECVVKR
jgi:hypothetical protein